MKPLVMNKKEAEKIILEFLQAPQNKKSKLWDRVVPYANKYPKLYVELITNYKHLRRKKDERN